MNLDKYQELAFRTCKDTGSKKLDILHMVVGLHSELDELIPALSNNDVVNIGEEYGDHYWYMSGLCTLYGLSFAEHINIANMPFNPTDDDYMLVTRTSKLANTIKRNVIYESAKDNTSAVSIAIIEVLKTLNLGVADSNLNLLDVLTNNINKLAVRFADKYTDYNAVNRDLESEREMLEG